MVTLSQAPSATSCSWLKARTTDSFNYLAAKLFNFHSLEIVARSTTLGEWKFIRFDKMEVSDFEILLLIGVKCINLYIKRDLDLVHKTIPCGRCKFFINSKVGYCVRNEQCSSTKVKSVPCNDLRLNWDIILVMGKINLTVASIYKMLFICMNSCQYVSNFSFKRFIYTTAIKICKCCGTSYQCEKLSIIYLTVVKLWHRALG